jgi:hypothetical protein
MLFETTKSVLEFFDSNKFQNNIDKENYCANLNCLKLVVVCENDLRHQSTTKNKY